MNFEVNSTNPVVKAIIAGTAPQPAKFAAARGMLPLPQNDLLEILVALANDADKELAQSARQTLSSQDTAVLQNAVQSSEIAPRVLDFFADNENLPNEIYEAILQNPKTPEQSIVKFARSTTSGSLLELISFNQQLLIKTPAIIDAIIANTYRTSEAERRAQEIKREFFEKERGAQQIANELRAQGKEAAAEFIETADFAQSPEDFDLSFEDAILLAQHIEVSDSEVDDSWLSLEFIEEMYEESPEEREAIVNKILGELQFEEDSVSGERISMINRILKLGMKDRMKLAMKGDREARNILIRDPNRIVAQAVINNAKITENEVEKIAAMRTVPEDVLRLIAINRSWARNYMIVHKLALNPRTPIGSAFTILTRLQLRDLAAIAKNRNVSDAVRKQALRLATTRTGR
ncbi:MAG: hypothetical protein ABJA66_18065 [Actinomycetota bacterium]